MDKINNLLTYNNNNVTNTIPSNTLFNNPARIPKKNTPIIRGVFYFLARCLHYTDCSENFRTTNLNKEATPWPNSKSKSSPNTANHFQQRRPSHDPIPPHPRRNRRRHHNLQKPQRHLQQLNNPNKGINHEPNRNLRRRNRRTHLPHLQKQITTNKGDYYDTDHRIRYRSIRTLRIPQKITPINKGTPAMTEIENFALAAEKLDEYLIGKRKQNDNATK